MRLTRRLSSSRCRWCLAALLLATLCATACRRAAAPLAQVPRTLDAIARDYVRLALALGERDPDSLDFAVVPDALRAEMHARYLTLDAIASEAQGLSAELERTSPADEQTRMRTAFLRLQLSAMGARTTMLRRQTGAFDAEAHALFNVDVLADRWAQRRGEVRAQVASLLPRAGLPGSSAAERYAAYDQRFLVPPERLALVMTAALGACRAQTMRFIQLPPGESVELRFVRNQPWSAFSRYTGAAHSTILVNLDLPLTVDAVLELACHEGYPGHHVFNTLREQALAQRRGWPEAAVQTTFSAQSYVSEAAAAFAPRLAFTLAERTAVERTLLFPLADLPVAEAERYVRVSSLVRELASAEPAVARDYLDGRVEFVRAQDVLAREALMAHAEPTLLYLNEYRSYMLAYTDGPERMGRWLEVPGSIEAYGQAAPGEGDRLHAWQRFRMLTSDEAFQLP